MVSCEHPRYIRNQDNDIIQVRCNDCNTCRNARANTWISRLDLERQAHKYCYMIFLSYDDEHLPCLFWDDDFEHLVYNRPGAERIPVHDLLSYCIDDDGNVMEDDVNYLRDRLSHPLGLPVNYPKDISDFCKRFNKYCFSHVTHTYENFRYFICHEYGPSTYREHCHGIFFFDNDDIARRFDEILHSCWTFGDCSGDAEYSRGARSYCAQYVNMSVHLPSFYRHPLLRQKQQFSKSPSIGSFGLSREKLSDLYDRIPVTGIVWNSRSSEYVTVPLDSSVKRQLFEKCQGYRRISFNARVAAYGAVETIPSESFQDFRSSLHDLEWLQFRGITSYDESKVNDYFSFLKFNCRDGDALESSLKRWYSLSKRIVWFSRILGTSVRYIVSRIEEFWKNVDYFNLCCFYSFQQSYAKMYSSAHLVWMYPELAKSLKDSLGDFTNVWDIGILSQDLYDKLESFGITQMSDLSDFHDCYDYKAMCDQSFRIYKDTHKRHACNVYRDFKLVRRDPSLSVILRNYQSKQVFNVI